MDEKIYKTSIVRVIWNAFLGLFGAGLAWFIAQIWLNSTQSIIIGVVIYLLYLWLVIFNNMITLTIKDNTLFYKKGSKVKQFGIDDHHFAAYTKTDNVDSEFYISVFDQSNNQTIIDCELIGGKQFEQLLEDLKITGDNQKIAKLETKE